MTNPTTPSVLLLALAAACDSPDPVEMPAPPPDLYVFVDVPELAPVPEAPVLISSVDQADAALGQRVRLVGTAKDAKLSAVIQNDVLLVYCMERAEDGLLVESRWPEGTVGQQVAATGTLEQSEQFVARVEPDGAVSQGTEGPILALVDFELSIVEPATSVSEPGPEPAPEPDALPLPLPAPTPGPAPAPEG